MHPDDIYSHNARLLDSSTRDTRRTLLAIKLTVWFLIGAMVVLASMRIFPFSWRGLGILSVLGLILGGFWWWALRSYRSNISVTHWVVPYSAPRWDSPLANPATLVKDKRSRYFLDEVPVTSITPQEEWVGLKLSTGVTSYIRKDDFEKVPVE
jgi:hypothetical protein